MQLIPGFAMQFGDATYIVPTLSLDALEKYVAPLQAFLNGETGIAGAVVVVDAAHAALKRNYPEISRDTVAAGVDLATLVEVVTALLDVGGVKRKALEASKAGSGNG